MDQASNLRPIWVPSPDRVAQSVMTAFRGFAMERSGEAFPDTRALHAWSLQAPAAFWETVWDFFDVPGEKGTRLFVPEPDMSDARFFPDARLNMAEVLLAGGRGLAEEDAIVFADETGARRRWSWDRLREEVASFRAALAAEGVNAGDRVAGLLPNIPEAVAAMLATLSLGAVWSSASPDFGVRGVLDRFGQIAPKVLITADGYRYAGKRIELVAKLAELQPFLPSVTRCIVVDHLGGGEAAAARLARGNTWERFTAPHVGAPLDLRSAPLRATRSNPLLLWNHGRAQVHPPPRGRGAPASEGGRAARRRQARRPAVLLHHAGLDDVELARLRLGSGGDDRPLRRLSVPPRTRGPLGIGRARARHPLRHLAQVPRHPP